MLFRSYLARSKKIFRHFDVQSKYFRPIDSSGNWAPNFSPDFVKPDSWNGPYFYEGSARDYATDIPHLMPQLVAAHGGPVAFGTFLDSIFTTGKFKIENEPSFLTPYKYLYSDRPSQTDYWVHRILTEQFVPARHGLPGQDDSGALSSWYVWSSIGLFPIAGTLLYLLTSPLFPYTKLNLGQGKALEITSTKASPSSIFTKSIRLNGKTISNRQLSYKQLMAGGKLEFYLTDKP